jgi:hypothetical protein
MPRLTAHNGRRRIEPASEIPEPESVKLPIHPDAVLRRRAVAAELSALGYPVAASTLATMAVRGGGPPYRVFGRIPLYRWADAVAWAEGRMSAPRCTTSEGDAQRGDDRCQAGEQMAAE